MIIDLVILWVCFIGTVIMMMIGKEGMRIECIPARGKDLRTDQDHRLLPDLVLKGDVAVSTIT